MPSRDQVGSDLRYVRQAVEAADRHPTPASIYLLWAAIGGVGFSLLDLAPERAAGYWFLAAPVGLALSMLLGWRHSRRVGQGDRAEGRRHALHWGSLVVAAPLASLLAVTGEVSGPALGRSILLLVAVVYYLAGLHLDRALLWVAGLLVAGYLALFVLPGWGWTVVGLTAAAGLGLCALFARPRRRAVAAG